jgi:hypothetical protein
MNEHMITGGLAAIMAMVLTAPFLSHKVAIMVGFFIVLLLAS